MAQKSVLVVLFCPSYATSSVGSALDDFGT
jgi:hypothetical protein